MLIEIDNKTDPDSNDKQVKFLNRILQIIQIIIS